MPSECQPFERAASAARPSRSGLNVLSPSTQKRDSLGLRLLPGGPLFLRTGVVKRVSLSPSSNKSDRCGTSGGERRRSRVLEQGRRFTVLHAEKADALQDRLLSLLSKCKQLGPPCQRM